MTIEERDSQILEVRGEFQNPLLSNREESRVVFDEAPVVAFDASDVRWPDVTMTDRTPAQRHTDMAFDHAQSDVGEAHGLLGSGLEWAESAVGPAIPEQFRRLPHLIGQFEIWLTEQRRLKG